ncbi:MAG TPA: hypothetical protein DIT05_16110 [Morganella sp. (in: Bacteria)]|nr:hypothetical protein [Morganella sp. (in: enterobacteria)]
MLTLKSFFHPQSRPEKILEIPAGYYRPFSAENLPATPQRQQWIKHLRDSSSLPKAQFQRYYQTPLAKCLVLMQQFPLMEQGSHARPGGMADYMLESLSYAVRLAKGYMLPPGAPPEEQAAQSTAWHAVIVYASMLSPLGYLCDVHIELANGKRWFPLSDAPPEPYRFRFSPSSSAEERQSFGAMLAWRIIPAEAILWLSNYPDAFRALSLYLSGFREQTGVVHHIISEAVRLTTGENEKTIAEDICEVNEFPAEHADNPGNIFWQWLVEGCRSDNIAINQPDNSVHLVGGYLFLPSPWIFRQFLSDTGGEQQEKAALQKAFERLRYHRRDNGTMFTCHLYQTENRDGQYRKLSGYLVPVDKVFTGSLKHGDNPRLVVIP